MKIRPVRSGERQIWLHLRERLWPHCSSEQLAAEQVEILADSKQSVLVAAEPDGKLIGFIEVAIREWAEGCSTRPVGYIEAWYVEREHRRRGLGRKLVEAAERWVVSQGCTEIGSDAELKNRTSRRAHGALGYSEVTRVVFFSKKLAP